MLRVLMLAVFVLYSWSAHAKVDVQATVDRNSMNEGDTFTLTISVSSGEGSFSVEQPRLPTLQGFDILNQWSGSESQASFVNGKFEVKRSQTYNFMMAPNKSGNARIGEIVVSVDGKAYKTKPINIKVVAGGAAPQQRQRRRTARPKAEPEADEEDIFSQLLKRKLPGHKTMPKNHNEAFFIQVETDKAKVFEGEQITSSWYIYTRGRIQDIDTIKYPTLSGFWKEDIELSTRLNFKTEVIDGLAYQKALLVSYALFPIKDGRAVIDSYKARCTVLTPSNFGFGRPRRYTKASRPLKIEVKPVPTSGRPGNYSGAVGRFDVSAKLDSKEGMVNQPLTLTIRFEGKGNAKLIDMPSLNLPESVELYDTTKTSKFFRNGSSFKEFKVLLTPREAGELVIPGVKVSAFDPATEQFYEKSTPEIRVQVKPGSGQDLIPSSPLAQNESKTEEKVERGPELALAWSSTKGDFGLIEWAGLWSSLFMLSFSLIGWRAYSELGLGQKKKDLHKLLQMRFREVHKRLSQDDWRGVGSSVTNLVYLLFGTLSDEGGGHAKLETLIQKAPPSVRREVAEPLVKLMKIFETLSFAPEEMIGDQKEKPQLKKTVAEMEKLLGLAVDLGIGKPGKESSARGKGASS